MSCLVSLALWAHHFVAQKEREPEVRQPLHSEKEKYNESKTGGPVQKHVLYAGFRKMLLTVRESEVFDPAFGRPEHLSEEPSGGNMFLTASSFWAFIFTTGGS